MPDPVADLLSSLNSPDRTRAAAWDAVYTVKDDRQAEQVLRSLPYSDDIKAQLWDARHGTMPTVQPPAAQEETAPQGSAAGRFLSNAASMLNPITAVEGLASAARHPINTATNIVKTQGAQFSKAKEDYSQGHYSEMVGHGVAGVVPLIGPAAAQAGEQIASGDVAGGLGTGAGLLTGAAAAGPATRAVGRVIEGPAQSVGRRLYQSALKPTKAVLKGVRAAEGPDGARQLLLDTGLKEGIPISSRGAQKVGTLIDSLNDEVSQRLSAATARGATVSPAAVDEAIKSVAADFTDQINAQPELSAIETVRQNFATNPKVQQPVYPVETEEAALQRHLKSGRTPQSFKTPEPEQAPGPISVQTAQRMKSNTYKGLRGKYGREQGGTIEAEKAGARSLKEGIEAQAPEVADLNARESRLIPLEQAIADAMRRRGNYGIFGLTPVVAAVPAVANGNFWPLLAAMTDRAPGVVSRAGIWINRAGSGRLAAPALRATTAGNLTSPSGSQSRTTAPIPLRPLPAH